MAPVLKYSFSNPVWQYNPPGGWYFVTLPTDLSREIRENARWQEEGWGRLKITARINNTEWKTAIWFDTKIGSYLLPLKAEVRKKERLEIGSSYTISIQL